MPRTSHPTGFILYRGPSLLDGAPIVVVATMKTKNRKTGNMVQTWILRDDMSPLAAVRSGADASVCGDCPHRGTSCYVNVGQAPSSVHRGLERGVYPLTTAQGLATIGRGRLVRLGAYGDPAAVPLSVWTALLSESTGHTGYTHQWKRSDLTEIPGLLGLVMASADSPADAAQARSLGARFFRIRGADDPLARGEFTCPASDEGGSRGTCADCLACDGSARGASKASPVIIAHGSRASRFIPITLASA